MVFVIIFNFMLPCKEKLDDRTKFMIIKLSIQYSLAVVGAERNNSHNSRLHCASEMYISSCTHQG